MITVAVSGAGQDRVLAQLRRLSKRPGHTGPAVLVVPEKALAGRADIFVALDAAVGNVRAEVLVACGGGAAEAGRRCGARTVVTVGLGPRDTLTLSSTLHEGGMAALQREMAGPGGLVTPREVDLTGLCGSMDEKMAVAAALLLLDPEARW